MLLKLLVARRVHTPFYVTLDSDVFLKRGTNYTDLVHQGRALYQGRLFQRAEGVGGGHRRQWWSAANDLLQANKCVSRRAPMSSNWVIGVTPAVVSANDRITKMFASTIHQRSSTSRTLHHHHHHRARTTSS